MLTPQQIQALSVADLKNEIDSLESLIVEAKMATLTGQDKNNAKIGKLRAYNAELNRVRNKKTKQSVLSSSSKK